MKKTMKIALAAAALVAVGGAGIATYAVAEGGKGGWRHASASHHWGGHHGRGHRVGRLLERFDANEDGKLTQSELDESRTKLLAKFDTDKDGKLSLTEFEALWQEVMRHRMVRGFQHLDADGSAQVTVDEFLKPYSDVVERLDSNEDGALGRDDQKRHGKHHRGGGRKHHRGSHTEQRG